MNQPVRAQRLTALDTNVLLRYYVQADAAGASTLAQCEAARALIESGKALFAAKTVVLEFEWVLRGFYKLNKSQVQEVLEHLLDMPQLELEDRVAVASATAALALGFDFADALHHASSRHCDVMASFDVKGFGQRASKHAWKPKVLNLAAPDSANASKVD
jgi:predicted nucleic-acid-binding protein